MKQLHIDFAPSSLMCTLSRVSALTWTLANVSLLVYLFFIVDGVGLWRKHLADQVVLQHVIARQQYRLARVPVVQKKSVPLTEITAVNTVIAQLNLPWRDVFDAIERATPADIALLSLEPDAARQTLKGTAEARDPAGMIAYIESLQQQHFFSEVELLHHETNEADTHKPVRFQFDIRWQGRAP